MRPNGRGGVNNLGAYVLGGEVKNTSNSNKDLRSKK
jgi:hypothetical protein